MIDRRSMMDRRLRSWSTSRAGALPNGGLVYVAASNSRDDSHRFDRRRPDRAAPPRQAAGHRRDDTWLGYKPGRLRRSLIAPENPPTDSSCRSPKQSIRMRPWPFLCSSPSRLPPSSSSTQLDAAVGQSMAEAGGPPDGLMSHVVYPEGDGFVVAEVWRTESAGQHYVDEVLRPLVGGVSLTATDTRVRTGLVLRPAMRPPQAAGPSARCRGSYRVNGRRKLALRSGQAVASTASRTRSSTADSSIA